MCNCIEMLNAALETTNTVLDIPLLIDLRTGEPRPARMFIAACKRDSKRRERMMRLPASYCPSCGEKYEDGPRAPGHE